MSKPVVVFDDQEIANSEPSTPFVTDRRCWRVRRGQECAGRVQYNPPADALLCPECGTVYDYRMEVLGISTEWDGDVDTVGAGGSDLLDIESPRTPRIAPIFETMLDSLIREQRESEMYGPGEVREIGDG